MKKITLLLVTTLTLSLNSQIRISEISYNPPESGSDSTEFVELYNSGNTDVDLNGYQFTSGFIHSFTESTIIKAGEFYVLAINSRALNNYYGAGTADGQWTTGGLSNGGEPITLVNASMQKVDSLRYDDVLPYPDGSVCGIDPDGGGPTIELIDFTKPGTDGANWKPSDNSINGLIINGKQVYGSPGQANWGACNALSVENLTQQEFKLAFNLVDDNVQIVGVNNKVDYVIYNMLGKKIKKGGLEKNEQINVKTLSKGMYFIRFKNGYKAKFYKK